MKKKRVAIVGTNGIPAKYGGFETLTNYLSMNLSQEYDVVVYCSKTPKEKRLKHYNNSRLKYLPLKANGWQSMLYDAVSIIHALFTTDVLIILGFSGVFAFPFRVFFRNKKILFNIGGIEWQKVRAGKMLSKFEIRLKKWFERITVKYSDIIIVDNQVLWEYVKTTYKIESVLAEYGGDHAKPEQKTEKIVKKYPFLNYKYDVSVSRAQEDMNIHVLLEAYKMIPNRNLVVISNWEISEYGINLKEKFKNEFSNIHLIDAIYDLQELNTIRSNASLYYHTHSLCGTAPSLVEAMYIGLPVFCYDVPTNRSSTENKSYYFTDYNSLVDLLNNLNDDDVNNLALSMKEIADRRYTWQRITSIYRKYIN